MSITSWNFACWTPRDEGPVFTRNNTGCVFELGPGSFFNSGTTQPFTDTITAIFSILIRSGGWTSTDGAKQGIASVGRQGAIDAGFRLSTNDLQNPGGRVGIQMGGWHSSNTLRYDIHLGDENGIDWLQFDKWYQVAVAINPSGMAFAVNGTNTPKVVISTNSPGAVDMDDGSERMWICGPNAAFNVGDAITASTEWPTMIFGASAYSTQYLDLNDSAVRGRIFDATGHFKNPGENGSLWFDDSYSANIPEFYFVNGSPIHQKGSDAQKWEANRGGGAGFHGCPAGMKKQYEDPYPAGTFVYLNLAEAEASGDPWQDGDSIRTANGTDYRYYSALDVDGHSGLIHADPFATNESLTSVVLRGSNAANTDPDTWAFTDNSIGVKGVDYELDTDAGRSRIRDLTIPGLVKLDSDFEPTATDVETFRILNDITVDTTGTLSNQRANQLYLSAYQNATDLYRVALLQTEDLVDWQVIYGSTDLRQLTSIPTTTPSRIWVYVRNGNLAVWFNDERIAQVSRTDPRSITLVSGLAQYICGRTDANSGTSEMNVGYELYGSFTSL